MSDIPSRGAPHGVASVTGVMRDQMHVDTYANQLRIGTTLSDFTLVFGIADDIGPGQMVIKDKVTVHLAPRTAKVLLANLSAMIEAHEEVLGEIQVPISASTHLKSAKANIVRALKEQLGFTDVEGARM